MLSRAMDISGSFSSDLMDSLYPLINAVDNRVRFAACWKERGGRFGQTV
ncbi:MAG: hypothetical protein RLZZ300_1865 [Pseudomonadota bacterium]|jgi:hypothetical protein